LLRNFKIFREYDIRGIADTDLSSEVMPSIGLAIGSFLRTLNCKKIAVARDCRMSSNRIHKDLCEALLKTGLDVIDVGLVPTPLLYFSCAYHKIDSGIMITGSHNPAEYNGLKICLKDGTIYGEQIQEIANFVKTKKIISGEGQYSTLNIEDTYINWVADNIQLKNKLSIVVDSGNGMAGKIAPKLYKKLGCDVKELFSELDGTFPHHHPDPTENKNLTHIMSELKNKKYHVGIAFDGDADRIGAIDSTGTPLFGDELLVIYSRELLKRKPGATIISDVKASNRLFSDIKEKGGVPLLWTTGHSLIKAKMKETGAELAGEMSGHVFFKDRFFGFDDAIYSGARLLEILSNTDKTPLELISDLPKSYSTAEIRIDCSDENKFEIVKRAKNKFIQMGISTNEIDGARLDFGDGWALVRASNTQPVLVERFEAQTEKKLQEIKSLVENVIQKVITEL
jgi:phosphomannomutase/phosphoglucomutase